MRDSSPSTGLTQTEASVLFSTARRGPVRMSELARDEDLNPTMLSRVVAGLVERGLLERVQDPADRRAVIVQATDTAAKLRKQVLRARTDVLAGRLERLSPEEARALEQALPILERLVDEMQDGRS
ncbi:MAG: hypothetical protein QOG77_1982 [Solirubrobacteraceae bacterium]|nr:hypothetical protein [Solirubrobacteraceae bacterium]